MQTCVTHVNGYRAVEVPPLSPRVAVRPTHMRPESTGPCPSRGQLGVNQDRVVSACAHPMSTLPSARDAGAVERLLILISNVGTCGRAGETLRRHCETTLGTTLPPRHCG
jgi:hypothetical protein